MNTDKIMLKIKNKFPKAFNEILKLNGEVLEKDNYKFYIDEYGGTGLRIDDGCIGDMPFNYLFVILQDYFFEKYDINCYTTNNFLLVANDKNGKGYCETVKDINISRYKTIMKACEFLERLGQVNNNKRPNLIPKPHNRRK